MRRLPIGPEEAFVLSRVDGRSSEAEIAAATGIEAARVRHVLGRLTELGAVRFDGPAPAQRPRAERSSVSGSRLMRPVIEASGEANAAHHPAAALYDPSELDEPIDIDRVRRRRILDTYYRLDSLSHYELLGLDMGADKKAVKQAYFEAVAVFHPDKYYGKNLGSFKPKLERVFQRLTDAHDVLTKSSARSEYDQYLATQRKNADLERMLSDERHRALELERARQRIEEEARVAERASHAPPSPTRVNTPEPRPLDPEVRRRALARKLGVTIPPPRPAAPPVDKEQIKAHVAEELKRRYEQRLERARLAQIERYVAVADEALAGDNPAAAANALRIAASLAPDDAELAQRLEEVQNRANVELAQSYLEQALYEERTGRLQEAAISYERASRGKPSAQILERAAHCLLEGNGDLRKAGELARKAVAILPTQPEPRLTLARIYFAAGMRESGLKELERASELSPQDASIKDWIKRVRRGEV